MNWQEFIDSMVGDKETFTNTEVRSLVEKALRYECDKWLSQEH